MAAAGPPGPCVCLAVVLVFGVISGRPGCWGKPVPSCETARQWLYGSNCRRCTASFPLTKSLERARKSILRDVAQPGSAPASGAGGR